MKLLFWAVNVIYRAKGRMQVARSYSLDEVNHLIVVVDECKSKLTTRRE